VAQSGEGLQSWDMGSAAWGQSYTQSGEELQLQSYTYGVCGLASELVEMLRRRGVTVLHIWGLRPGVRVRIGVQRWDVGWEVWGVGPRIQGL
jgi:hypothetical protein